MLRPSARAAKASPLAAESMSASLPLISGNSSAAAATQTTARRVRVMLELSRIAGIFARKAGPRSMVPTGGGLSSSAMSRFRWRGAAEQARRHKDQHEDQDRKDDHIGPAHCDQLAAQSFDQSDQQTAEHRPRDAADAAQHRRRKRTQPRRIADDEARVIVIEAKDQRRGPSQRRSKEERRDDDAVDIDSHHPCRLS